MDFENNRLLTLYIPPKNINNIYGRYWAWMHVLILAHLGLMKARSGTYTDPWNSKLDPLMKLPNLYYVDHKLHDLLNSRAIDIFNKAKQSNRRIYMMWSGGIDSTAVLSAFLRNLSTADHDIITVVMSQDSVNENPHFYSNYIDGKLNAIQFVNFNVTEDFLKNKGIIITGDPADALQGPSVPMYEHLVPTGDHLKPFAGNEHLIIDPIEAPYRNLIKKNNIVGFGSWYVNKVSANLHEIAPPGVESIADWWWWHYINLKWEASIWRPLLRRKVNLEESLSVDTINEFVTNTFFNTPEFQRWSYSNRHQFITNNDPMTHKRQLKEYIFEFDKNQDYFEHKTKVQSVPPRIVCEYPSYVNWDWSGVRVSPELEACVVAKLEEYKG